MYSDPATLPCPPRIARRAISDRLRDALQALCRSHARIAHHRETAWASVTFAGTRHRLDLLFEGDEGIAAGEAFIAALPDHEFSIPRHLVADASVREVVHTLLPHPRLAISVELLLLEDM